MPKTNRRWKLMKWGDLVTLEYGKSLRDYREIASGSPVYGTNGKIGYTQTPLVDCAGVIIGRKGAYRGVHYSPEPFFVIDTAFYLKPKVELDLKWAYYELLTQDINTMDSGSAIPSTSRDDFYQLSVLVPPLDDQKSIASILGSLDDKIEMNRRMNTTLESMAQAIFKSWFIDFDPVHRNAAKRSDQTPNIPQSSNVRQPASNFDDLFPDSFEESEVGLMPRGWRHGSILEKAKLLRGGTPKTSVSNYWDGVIPWASAKDVSQCNNAFLITTERMITDAGLNNSSTRMIPKFSTVIVSRGATTGRLVMFGKDIDMNQTCYGLSSNDESPLFLYCHARNFIATIVSAAHGSVSDTITTTTFQTAKVLLPPRQITSAFDFVARSLFEIILCNQFEVESLSKARDVLLPKLFSGDLSTSVATPHSREQQHDD